MRSTIVLLGITVMIGLAAGVVHDTPEVAAAKAAHFAAVAQAGGHVPSAHQPGWAHGAPGVWAGAGVPGPVQDTPEVAAAKAAHLAAVQGVAHGVGPVPGAWAGVQAATHGGLPAPVQDTPEVAAARAAHLAAVHGAGPAPGAWGVPAPGAWSAPGGAWAADQAGGWVGAGHGAPVDTPEVAAARAAHLAAHSAAAGHRWRRSPRDRPAVIPQSRPAPLDSRPVSRRFRPAVARGRSAHRGRSG